MVQDVFFGKETVVHIKPGALMPLPEVLEKQFAKLEIECRGVRRDDSAMP